MKSYKKISAIQTTMEIVGFLADQREPVSGKSVADALQIPQGTVMCHLATLEDGNWVHKIGEYYETGQALAVIWARKKAALKALQMENEQHLNDLEA